MFSQSGGDYIHGMTHLVKANCRQNTYIQVFNLAMGIMFEVLKGDSVHTQTHTAPCLGNNAYQAYVIASLSQISSGDRNWFGHL